jgi:iron complex outermembrane recepter protein
VLALFALFMATATTIWAQAGTVSGRLVHSLSGDPVRDAVVRLEEIQRETKSGADGSFSFQNVPAGQYHLIVSAQGFLPNRRELMVPATGLTQDVTLDPELHFTDVSSVSIEARDQFETYQPTAVLAGQDLTKELQGTIGAALNYQPGVAQRSFGPGPARPIIRGLDGDRVLILENGMRMGDLSSQSGDHGVNINPAGVTRIEVVRGPATLMYGANAIGGLVNVITNDIPRVPISGARGGFTVDGGTAASEGGGAGDVSWGNNGFAVQISGSGRRSGDYDTPEETIPNSYLRSGFINVGASRTTANGYLGASYGYDRTHYGIPFVEEGQTNLDPRRNVVNVRGERTNLNGFINAVRGSYGYRRYRHDELDGEEVVTQFKNDISDFEFKAGHRAVGRMTGSFGVSGLIRSFSSEGEEALSPPVDQSGFSGFLYEEFTWPHFTFQLGARGDHSGYEPGEDLTSRSFNTFSGSVGLLVRPNEATTVAFSLARAARYPALEELYFNGPHPGNFAFEVGNPDLDAEHALGFDVSFRWRHSRASGEVTYFRNDISDYIFRNPTGEFEEEFPVIEFSAADSLLQGVESHMDLGLTRTLFVELGLDYVRGEIKDSGVPLPRIPPLRFQGGLRYQRDTMQFGGELVSTAKQDRVFDTFGIEQPTDGYNLLRLFASYSFVTGMGVNTITARLENATNELYRNHLSYLKELAPEMGRNFKVVYGVRF